jgi:putative membrane protein
MPIVPGLWLALVVAAGLHVLALRRLHRRRRPWSRWRAAAFAAGLMAIAVALASPLAAHDDRFPVHMAQHLLLGMLAPLALALAAPVALALRTLSPAPRRALVAVLHSRAARILMHPALAAAVFAAGPLLLYFTPLYDATARHPLLHELVHVHVLLAGCLFAWAFAGLDPVPRPGPTRRYVAALLFALAAHAAMAKLLYAGAGAVTASPGEVRTGAQLMYYGGDVADVLLLTAFLGRWYAAGGRRLERERRREVLAASRIGTEPV